MASLLLSSRLKIQTKAFAHMFIMPLYSGTVLSTCVKQTKEHGNIHDIAWIYNNAIPLSPSDNFICRDWRKYCDIAAPFPSPVDKERLLAFIPWDINDTMNFSVFQGSRYIQSECTNHTLHPDNRISVLFNVDTGRTAEVPPVSMFSSLFPNLLSSSICHYRVMGAGVQLYKLCWLNDSSESIKCSHHYEVIKRHDRPCPSLHHNNSLDDDWGHYKTDSKDGKSVFISILNTQTLCCDNYLLLVME